MLSERFEESHRHLYRNAPLPPALRQVSLEAAVASYDPDLLGAAIGDLLEVPPAPDTSHIRQTVSIERRLMALREALSRRSSFDFDDEFGGEDRFTQAVTLFALLELYRKGEADWVQRRPFGAIKVRQAEAEGRGRMSPLARKLEALLFLSAQPVPAGELALACEATDAEVAEALPSCTARSPREAGASSCARSPAATHSPRPRRPRRRRGGCSPGPAPRR